MENKNDKAYGSGYFGEWIEDENGLPAYKYTCNQIKDPKAVTPTNEFWRKSTDQSHQVGNDRLVAVASNYGYVQVRQDEGSPKFLNDYCPEEYQFGGGLGYLVEGNRLLLTTYYTGNQPAFDRVFGIGYYRKKVSENGITADQVIFAPFGDDPLVISQVNVSNMRSEPVKLRWIEYWGCKQYQFSYRAFMQSFTAKKDPPYLRRQFAKKFVQEFNVVGAGEGIACTSKFTGFSAGEKLNWSILNLLYATVAKRITGGAVKSPVKEAKLEDLEPPKSFLVSLDGPVTGMAIDAREFFGSGGTQMPTGASNPLSATLAPKVSPEHRGLIVERTITLAPGESKALHFAFGYLAGNTQLDALLDKYKNGVESRFKTSCQQWKAEGMSLDVPGEPWIAREVKWHDYYLRGNLTYDSFFGEHILSQGHVYQYLIGFQGAARDPLQHVLPFIYSDPGIVKEILRYTLKSVDRGGKVPYGLVGSGMIMPAPFVPSDLELWVLWVASEYILATKDREFLNESIKTYPVYGPKTTSRSVKDTLLACHDHLMQKTGTGEHGLLKISNGDWNDMVIHGYVPSKQVPHVEKIGESVLNTAMATHVLDLFARMLAFSGDGNHPEQIKSEADGFRAAVKQQWNGRWFKRAWLGEGLGWVGDDALWLEPQPWAIIGGSAGPGDVSKLLVSINAELREPSRLGARILNKPVAKAAEEPGTGTNAGIWYSINGTLVWALSRAADARDAWDEWKKNSLANHADVYPDIWYGTWSAPDCVNSELSKHPGMTGFKEATATEEKKAASGLGGIKLGWTDFPVMNMHPHAWPLINIAHLLGISFLVDGVEFAPAIPIQNYKFSSKLVGFSRSTDELSGWYAPSREGTWKVRIKLPPGEAGRCKSIEVDGKIARFEIIDESICFSGVYKVNYPLRWCIQFQVG
nr:hypothetical protein [Candidatus Sigynarchaeota archaeon]